MIKNYSLESDLSPRALNSEIEKQDSLDFLNSFAGRKALLTLLKGFYLSTMKNNRLLFKQSEACRLSGDDEKCTYLQQLHEEQEAANNSLLKLVHDVLEIDYADVPDLRDEQYFLDFWTRSLKGDIQPVDALRRTELFVGPAEGEGFWDKMKSRFNTFIDSWRGYSPDELKYSKSDAAFRESLSQTPGRAQNPLSKSFSNVGVKSMKVKRPVRKSFSNDVACDMLANKLTKDWFICEPECQPLIAEQLKAACVPAATFAPALKCNIMQYDGEAKVSAKELAALDKVQQFVQALKDEIACGNDCGGIKLVPEAKAFSLKRQLKRQLKNFAAEGEIEMEEIGTPAELIEAEAAGIDLEHPEMYEEFVDKVEAGEVAPEAMGLAPAVTAPTSVDPAAMGKAYDDLVDSTIADNGGIEQEDMSGYDAAPGDLSLSAAPVGDAMAQAQADAIIWDDADEATPMKAVVPVAPMANPQAFSRTLRRRQAGATAKNFANTRKPVQQKAQPQATQSMKGLYRLLGDKYIK